MLDNLISFPDRPSPIFLTPVALFHVVWSTFLGIIIGALPGLTATMGVGADDHADLQAGAPIWR